MKKNEYFEARTKAIESLGQIFSEQKHLDDVLEDYSGPHRHWLQDVCSGVLRYHGRLQGFLTVLSMKSRPTGRLGRALEVALYQMLYHTEVKPEMVIDETVEWVKVKDGIPPSRFANAVLRKALNHLEGLKNPPIRTTDVDIATWTSLPVDWVKQLKKERGLEWLQKYALAALERPVFWFRKKGEFEPQPLENARDLEKNGLILAGEAFVQDRSSQKLVKWAGEHLTAGATILDYCAAPGGKAVGLSWDGFAVTATDVNEKRMLRLDENVKKLAPMIRIAKKTDLYEQQFDAVWVDAPCSGSGIIQKHPEIRWIRSIADIHVLEAQQIAIIKEALKHLKKEGLLIYSVCSVFRSECDMAKIEALGLSVVDQIFIDPQNQGDGFQALICKWTPPPVPTRSRTPNPN